MRAKAASRSECSLLRTSQNNPARDPTRLPSTEGEVDHNERLTLSGIQAGRYDVKLGDKKGRVCTIKNVDVQEGNPVIIREQDLANCTR
jgi:hypothetical protein